MKFGKRLAAGLTAAISCASLLTVFPTYTSSAVEVVRNDFEVTYEGWYADGDAAVMTAEEMKGYEGSRGMVVTGRETPQQGASSSKGFYLWGDQTYDYSVRVYSESDETFHLSALCIDEETGAETVAEIGSVKAKAGKWTTLGGKYKAPKGSYEFKLTITTDSTCDFRFDDVVITGNESAVMTAEAVSGNGLKDWFKGYGFRVGNIFNSGTIRNSGITAQFLKDYDAVECENETKPDATLVANGSTNDNIKVKLDGAAAILDFASKNNIAFRGHTFVWHSQTPEWFFKEGFNQSGAWVSSSTMDQRMESYIKNMFALYQTQYPNVNLYAYDVVNEATSDDSGRTANAGGARTPGYGNGNSPWVQVYGDNSFIEKAFTYARKYAPSGCKLYYNDYNEYWDHKRDSIINKIIKPLKAKNVLDGMGMQSHVDAGANTFSGTNNYIKAMDMYLACGVDVQVSELDISLDNGQSLQDQATKYKAIVQHIIEVNTSNKYQGRVTLFQVWGPNDANTWISGDKSPTLMDKNNQPKVAYTTLKSYGESLPVGTLELDGGGEYIPPEPPKLNDDGTWFHDTFEDGSCNWTGRGAATASQTSGGYDGKGMECTGRTATWNGISKELNYQIFEGGTAYAFGVIAKHTGSSADTMHFTVQYTGTDGETHYDKICTIENVEPDQWVLLSNSSYTLPAGSNHVIYVETGDLTGDIYIDEAIGAPEGYKFSGPAPKPAKKRLKGDVDGNGNIDARDLTALKRGYKAGKFEDSISKYNADVDSNGTVERDDIDLLVQYLLKKITEFPVIAGPVDWSKYDTMFQSVTPGSTLKGDKNANVLSTQRFGADPGWMVYKDRLYIYTTNDAFEYKNGQMQENSYDVWTINCVSTADMVNWTDHGAIPAAGRRGATSGAAKWANNSWAPDACWKTINGKDKFFLYFADNGSGIGVLTADSPTGPWTDPIGKQLISRSTPNCNNVTWLFDPGAYYDEETGKGYIAFGGGVPDGKAADPGTGRIVQLGDDMISVVGTPTTMNTPYLFEDSSLIKADGKWIYSFCHNWNVPGGLQFSSADIGYMSSSNPLGPYNYEGVVFKNTGSQGLDRGGNNHHSIIYFKNQYYVAYHTRAIEIDMGVNGGKGFNYRSTAINKCNYSNGKFSCTGDKKGVSQIEALDPYAQNQAETMYDMSGIQVTGVGNTVVTDINKGDWIQVKGCDFGAGASSITIKAKSKDGAVVKVCTGGNKGDAVSYIEIPAGTNNMEEFTSIVKDLSGKTDIWFVFSGDMEFDAWQFN